MAIAQRLRRGAFALGCTLAAFGTAAAAPATLADCDAPGIADVLVRELHPLPHARAHWLGDKQIQWPGRSGDGERFVLALGDDGRLRTEPGEAPLHAAALLPLEVDATPLTAAQAGRFRHLAPGVRLRLPSSLQDDAAAWASRWQGEVRLVALDGLGRVLQATRLQIAAALDERFAPAADDDAPPLGVTVTQRPARTAWRLWAPTARAVQVCRYPSARGPAVALQAMAFEPATGTWATRVPLDASGGFYRYLVDVWVPGTGLVRQRVGDPYAVSLSANGERAWIGRLDDPRTEPSGWRVAKRPPPPAHAVDMAIYELHVRDFSLNDATVPPAQRGKYAAFTHPGSHGLRHLKTLARAGLRDVHLLPVFDIATVPERDCLTPQVPDAAPDSPLQQAAVMAAAAADCFNWGYDPLHFNAPEGSYALDPDDAAARLREFRAMVLALHRLGLRVGMDVVYNHLSASGQHPHSVLDRIVPGYYHRLDAEGRVERSTCCDNSATEHAMMGRLMRDSVRLWARAHRIDSFRFDLMGHQPRSEMLRLKALLRRDLGRDVPLIGEGWNFGEVADGARFVQASQLSLAGRGIATFSDRARDALRGGSVGDDAEALVRRQGVLNGLGLAPNERWVRAGDREGVASYRVAQRDELLRAKDLVRLGLAGTLRDVAFEQADGTLQRGEQMRYSTQPAGYAQQPGEVVNYVENHDNHTLWDLDALKLPLATPSHERARVQVLGLALTALSQGLPYFHAGIELLRSKSLDGNSYDSGDWFNALDYSGTTHAFGRGLPPGRDNAALWPAARERLVLPQLRATPQDIDFTRRAMADWLAVRTSSTAWRLRSADEVAARLRFLDTGPAQQPGLLAWTIDARGLPGGGFAQVLALVNVDVQPLDFRWPEARGRAWSLHPVLATPQAADAATLRNARFDVATGGFTLPPRTAAVWVLR